MPKEIEIVERKGSLFVTLTFSCTHCLHTITKTFNTHSMYGVIECSHCGRTMPNQCILTTDINERITKHVIC